MKKILFLCTGNSCRSQMAEGFAKDMLKFEKHLINSAGVSPEGLNNFAVQVMGEVGVDISTQYSKNVNTLNLNVFDMVVTVCDNAKKKCPIVRHKKLIHYNFNDPASSKGTISDQLTIYRKVRDEIKQMIKNLLTNYDELCQELN